MGEKLAIEGGTPVRTDPWPELYPGGLAYGEEEKQAVMEVVEAQSPFRYYGVKSLHKVDQLEEGFRKQVGVKHALAVGSGTTALSVALAALEVGPGTEVILPALMWVSDVCAVVNLRGIPVLAEIDDTWGLDPNDLESRITPRTKAIVAIHMAGSVADTPAILKVAERHGIPVLEDCSQAAGASIFGKQVGSMGAIATFSLQYNKNITTGEGGMIVTNDNDLYLRCTCYHDLGFGRDVDGVSRPLPSGFQTFGMGTRMDELRGAVGTIQIKRLPELVRQMRGHQQRIWGEIKDIKGIEPRRLVDPDGDSGANLAWMHESKEMADKFCEALKAEGIPAGGPPPELHQYRNMTNLLSKAAITTAGCPWSCPFNKESVMEYSADLLPRSNDILDRSLMVPMPPKLTEQDEEDFVRAFRKVAAALLE